MTEVPGKDADVCLLLAGDKSVLSTCRVSTLQLYDNLKDMVCAVQKAPTIAEWAILIARQDSDVCTLLAGNKTILTTGRDNTLKLYNKDMSELCSTYHNNNTGRWVMPLRATLGPNDTIICGSMKRAVRSR